MFPRTFQNGFLWKEHFDPIGREGKEQMTMTRAFRIAMTLLALAVTAPRVVMAQQRLPDGVIRYDKSGVQGPWFWQYVSDKFGWIIKSRPFNRSVAFLVGVGSYRYLTPQLRYVTTDVDALRTFLLSEGGFDTVYVATDGVATASLVDDYMFNVLPKTLASEDRLLFYFSGHGADVGDVGYMQFGDATASYSRNQYLEVTRTEQWSTTLPAKHVLFLIDACNAGLGFAAKEGSSQPDEGLIAQFSGDGSRNVLTAGFGREKAFQVEDGNRQGYSVFTRAFLDSIRQTQSAGGFLTLSEIMAGVERRVAEFSRGNPSRQMTPRRWPLFRSADRDRGTFVFVNPNVRNPSLSPAIRAFVNVAPKNDAPVATSNSPSPRELARRVSPVAGTWHELRTMWDIGRQADEDVGLDFVLQDGSSGIVASVVNLRARPPAVLAKGQGTFNGNRLSLTLSPCPGVETQLKGATAIISPDGSTLTGTQSVNFKTENLQLFKRASTTSTPLGDCQPFTGMTLAELIGTWTKGRESLIFEANGSGGLRGSIIETDPCGQPTLNFPLVDITFSATRLAFSYFRKEPASAWQCPGEDFRRPTVDVNERISMSGVIQRDGPYEGGLWLSDNISRYGGHVFRKK